MDFDGFLAPVRLRQSGDTYERALLDIRQRCLRKADNLRVGGQHDLEISPIARLNDQRLTVDPLDRPSDPHGVLGPCR